MGKFVRMKRKMEDTEMMGKGNMKAFTVVVAIIFLLSGCGGL
jgi:hypothetical protein